MTPRKITFLLIDDSARDRMIISRYFELIETWDAVIFTAKNTEEGRKILTGKEIDVILLDERLGSQSGLEVLSQMRDSGINVPVILITGVADAELPTKLIHAGGDDYLTKDNLDAEILRDSVEFVLKEYTEEKARRQREVKLLSRVKRDSLTGLLGRRYFMSYLRESIQRAIINEQPLYFFLIDLDNFKLINDELGHVTGDEVLAELGKLLLKYRGKSGEVGRYGGDEFCLFQEAIGIEEAIEISRKIHRDSFFMLEHILGEQVRNDFESGLSLGVAIYKPSQGYKQLIERADQALRKAKSAGKNCIGLMDKISSAKEDKLVDLVQPEFVKIARERKSPRRCVNKLPVKIKYDSQEIKGKLQEFSSGGLRLQCESIIPNGAEIQVKVPDTKAISMFGKGKTFSGQVKWTKTELGLKLET